MACHTGRSDHGLSLELLELLAINPETLGHRLDRLALSRHEQTLHVQRGTLPTLAAADLGDQRFDERLQCGDSPALVR